MGRSQESSGGKKVGDRVRHKSGLTGRIVSITEWVYVLIDESRTVVPYYAGSLEVIED
jgi:preprotein translocase subunit YajC